MTTTQNPQKPNPSTTADPATGQEPFLSLHTTVVMLAAIVIGSLRPGRRARPGGRWRGPRPWPTPPTSPAQAAWRRPGTCEIATRRSASLSL